MTIPDKASLRAQALDHLSRLDSHPDTIETILEAFLAEFPVFSLADKVVALYWPIKGELDMTLFIDVLLGAKLDIALPVVVGDSKVLEFRLWDGKSELVSGGHGTKAPHETCKAVDPDIIVTPLLAFDRQGYRLGRGGGYYDATLSHCRAKKDKLIAVGLGQDAQLCLFPLPREDHDEPLDLVITETRTYRFNEKA
ncbi:MAG: 5-formyltetrahydrofolate cyclo-ligase [Pseudobdellovibrionaceae bacterium]